MRARYTLLLVHVIPPVFELVDNRTGVAGTPMGFDVGRKTARFEMLEPFPGAKATHSVGCAAKFWLEISSRAVRCESICNDVALPKLT